MRHGEVYRIGRLNLSRSRHLLCMITKVISQRLTPRTLPQSRTRRPARVLTQWEYHSAIERVYPKRYTVYSLGKIAPLMHDQPKMQKSSACTGND
jgi:hypothetical protein